MLFSFQRPQPLDCGSVKRASGEAQEHRFWKAGVLGGSPSIPWYHSQSKPLKGNGLVYHRFEAPDGGRSASTGREYSGPGGRSAVVGERR
jgi:hypothetical protein